MKSTFSIHFTPNGQKSVSELYKKLDNYLESNDMDIDDKNMVHCFLPKKTLAEKNIAPTVYNDFLDKLFCYVEGWQDVSPDSWSLNDYRVDMLKHIKSKNGTCIFVGDIQGGVEVEYNMAKEMGCNILQIP